MNRSRNLRGWIVALGISGMISATGLSGGEARAEIATFGTLREIVAEAAASLMTKIGDDPITLGEMTPDGFTNLNGGPQIVELLREELNKLKAGMVLPGVAFPKIEGKYSVVDSPDPKDAGEGQKVVQLAFTVIFKDGKSLKVPISRFLRNNTSIMQLFQISGPVPDNGESDQTIDRRLRNREIFKLLTDPKSFVDTTHPSLVSTGSKSPFKIEVVAGPMGDGKVRPTEARPARIEEGLAFVDVKRDELYELKIHNASDKEVAVRLFIDGIDVFHFSKDRDPNNADLPMFTHFIVPPNQNGVDGLLVIPGWHNSLKAPEDNFLGFLVTELGKGVSRFKIPTTGTVGVIQAQFSDCSVPDSGLLVQNGEKKKGITNETTQGPGRIVPGEAVTRTINPAATDVVAVRYTH